MSLMDVVIDERTLGEATSERRLEWEALVQELLDPSSLVFREDARTLHVGVTQQHWHLVVHDEHETIVADVTVPADLLAELVREYVDIVRQMGDDRMAPGSARLDALDMAKKVTHDKAGRVLKRHGAALGMDHTTARRLFSLLLSLRIDTTKLLGIHGHRTIR